MLLGPAFVAAIAYVDPGNVAANLTGGARYGYLLVWVLVVANFIAALVQYQRSVEAASRVMWTIDDTISTIINRMGRVGL